MFKFLKGIKGKYVFSAFFWRESLKVWWVFRFSKDRTSAERSLINEIRTVCLVSCGLNHGDLGVYWCHTSGIMGIAVSFSWWEWFWEQKDVIVRRRTKPQSSRCFRASKCLPWLFPHQQKFNVPLVNSSVLIDWIWHVKVLRRRLKHQEEVKEWLAHNNTNPNLPLASETRTDSSQKKNIPSVLSRAAWRLSGVRKDAVRELEERQCFFLFTADLTHCVLPTLLFFFFFMRLWNRPRLSFPVNDFISSLRRLSWPRTGLHLF